MQRRDLLYGSVALLGAGFLHSQAPAGFSDSRTAWDAALETLRSNIQPVAAYGRPVLLEGSTYRGTWLECGPHESLAYAQLSDFIQPLSGAITPLQVAENTHRAFFALQRPNGQLPANVKTHEVGWKAIQMVVPIAATAWELSQLNRNQRFLEDAYQACARWDNWLCLYRNTRGTGLVEAFCTYDTGQDHSPRWAGVAKACPGDDAARCPPDKSVPRLCPDLSATTFGARVALSAMAAALGKNAESQRWMDQAEHIRQLILTRLWCEEDASFYDVDPAGNFVRIRSVANLRVLGEHVLRRENRHENAMFQQLWKRQLSNPTAYWSPYPFPSIALDDPTFVRPIPRNSWGGASQALTALRTLRWMDFYGKEAESRQLMSAWHNAILRAGAFYQQLDPISGQFTQPDPGGYSPCALAFLHFVKRLGKPNP